MIKVARKASSDPVQEKLRETKSLWNKDVSSFINDLINFKKTMNGAPSKFSLEKGSIKDPIPGDPNTIIGVLVSDFNDLAQRSNRIVNEQIEYSKNRKKPRLKTDQPLLPQNLLSASTEYQLIAEGSNPITRFFVRLFNPPIGFSDAAKLRRARVSMLNAAANTFYKLEKFQVHVVSSSKDSIHEAQKMLEDASHSWNLLARAFQLYQHSEATLVADKGGEIKAPTSSELSKDDTLSNKKEDSAPKKPEEKPTEEKPTEPKVEDKVLELPALTLLELVKNLATDYRKNHQAIPPGIDGGGYLRELDAAVDKLIASRSKKIHPDFENIYRQSLIHLNKELGTNAGSFKELATQLSDKKENPAPQNIEKASQALLKKWIGKTRHQMGLFDETSPFRLNCYDKAVEIRGLINEVMNLLEQGLNEEQLAGPIQEVNKEFVTLRGIMSSLHLSTRERK